jgi:Cadherin domain/RTX calcium-binding nonapeptide repeat (4 copies)
VQVRATDNGSPALSDTQTITVNVTNVNEVPTNITGTLAVNEIAANGTLVGTVAAQDVDSATFTYTLLDNAGGRFAINNNGQVTVVNGLLLDFEQSNSHTIVVRATDPGNLFVDRTLTVTVNDVNPETIVGDAANNTFVGGALADSINGGGGADTMTGRQGDDFYFVDNPGDQVVENPGEGQDRVYVTVSGYTLAANVELGAVNVTTGLTLNANATQGRILYGKRRLGQRPVRRQRWRRLALRKGRKRCAWRGSRERLADRRAGQ